MTKTILVPVEPTQERIDALEYKVAVAYQIVGALFHGVKYSEEDQLAAQDFLAYDDAPDPLPWPKAAAPKPPIPADDREEVARAIAEKAHGVDPDEMAPKTMICGPNSEPMPWWKFYEEDADAAISTLQRLGWKK